jgi:hypothetical protein
MYIYIHVVIYVCYMHNETITLDGGSLGSRVDEERS